MCKEKVLCIIIDMILNPRFEWYLNVYEHCMWNECLQYNMHNNAFSVHMEACCNV